MRRVGQKVCSGFPVRCYRNTRKEPFGQPNGLVGLTEPTLWLYRWGSGPVLANGQKSDLPSPDHRDEFRIRTSPLWTSPSLFRSSAGKKPSSLEPGLLSQKGMSLDGQGPSLPLLRRRLLTEPTQSKSTGMEKESRRGTQL